MLPAKMLSFDSLLTLLFGLLLLTFVALIFARPPKFACTRMAQTSPSTFLLSSLQGSANHLAHFGSINQGMCSYISRLSSVANNAPKEDLQGTLQPISL